MPAGTIAPFPLHQFFDASGDPLNGAKLFCYAAGTTTKENVYQDVSLSVAHTNPIVLNSAGRPPAAIYLSPTSYKFVLAPSNDTDPPTSPLWTVDNVPAVPPFSVDLDVTGTAGEALSASDVVYLSAGDGSRTAGRWYKAKGDTDYMSTTANAIGMAVAAIASGASGSIRLIGRITGLSGLTIGTTYYVGSSGGNLTATAPPKRRRVGVADSATSLIISPWIVTEPTVLRSVTTTAGNVGTGEDTLSTYSIPAAKLDGTGMAVRVLFWGKAANNANAKTLRLRLIEGANNTVLVTLVPTVSEAGEWLIGGEIMRTGATTTRMCASAVCGPSGGNVNKSVSAVSQPTATWGNAVEVRLTGDATANDDLTVEGGRIIMYPAGI